MRSATVVLPVPGLPVKHMCSDGRSAARPHRVAQAVDHEQRRDLADARLDGRERDQLAVELVRAHLVAPRRIGSSSERHRAGQRCDPGGASVAYACIV